jgi:hypothetical protein
MCLRERTAAAGKIGRNGFLNRAVGCAVILLLPPEAEAGENAQSVGFQRQIAGDSGIEQDFLRRRIADIRKLLQGFLGVLVREFQKGIQVAIELVQSDSRNFTPAEDTCLRPHASSFRKRKQQGLWGVKDLLWSETYLIAQSLEYLCTPLVW